MDELLNLHGIIREYIASAMECFVESMKNYCFGIGKGKKQVLLRKYFKIK